MKASVCNFSNFFARFSLNFKYKNNICQPYIIGISKCSAIALSIAYLQLHYCLRGNCPLFSITLCKGLVIPVRLYFHSFANSCCSFSTTMHMWCVWERESWAWGYTVSVIFSAFHYVEHIRDSLAANYESWQDVLASYISACLIWSTYRLSYLLLTCWLI